MARAHGRNLRVAGELHQLLSELLRTEVKDPRLEDVRINEVEVSGDLGVAKIFFGTLDPDDDPAPAVQALKHANGFLRSRVGQQLQLRRVPELRFVWDESLRRGLRLTQLIEGVAPADDEATADEPRDES